MTNPQAPDPHSVPQSQPTQRSETRPRRRLKARPRIRTTPLGENLELWLRIIAVSLISLVAFEVIAVATAMPYVVADLGGIRYYALASGIALAAQVVTTAIAGVWCDAQGPKKVLYTGIILFVAGLVITTFATNTAILVVGRAIQGLGSGLLIVPLYVMVSGYIPKQKQPAVFASFAAAWILPSLIGPVIAGIFVDYLHWRWVFGITPVLIVIAAPFGYSKIKQFPPLAEPVKVGSLHRLLFFALAAGISVACLQILSGTQRGHFTPITYILIALSSVACFAFMRPLLPAGTLSGKRGLPASIFFRGLINGTYITVELFLPLLLKEVHSFSPTSAGFVMTVGSITWAAGSWWQGRVTNARIRAKFPLIGTLMQLGGMLLTVLGAFPSLPGETVFIGWLIASTGLGISYPAMTVHALALTERKLHGKTSSALQISDTLGSAMLIAYAGILFSVTRSFEHHAFTWVIGFSCAVLIVALVLVRRITAGENESADCTY
ncbi:MFS transporter [Arcanobacterium bovis]|uniref:MFS transporter n=1 Tax=Arcanobacterium bovis TaxID=2529275 RepID=A0A4Q9V346_9ACTO|nr:MFS transporter [Arcanobacterium bovis]TBW22892.1 MFS transporter [Arcanobacterium bovis]